MRVYAEAEIWLARPVLEIVARLEACAREVRNFILRDAGGMQTFAGVVVEIRGGFFVWNEVRVVARSAGNQFASQSGIANVPVADCSTLIASWRACAAFTSSASAELASVRTAMKA